MKALLCHIIWVGVLIFCLGITVSEYLILGSCEKNETYSMLYFKQYKISCKEIKL